MTCHFPALGSATDWLKQISIAAQPIRSTTQLWVVTRHEYGIYALVPQSSFFVQTSGGVEKCRALPQAKICQSRFLCSYTTFLTKRIGEERCVKAK